jgi:twin arginine-targeting protein translocase, TatA/E family
MHVGWSEIVLIVFVALMLFGAKRIPEIARAIGRASYEFKKAKAEIQKEGEDLLRETEKTAEKAAAEKAAAGKAENGETSETPKA